MNRFMKKVTALALAGVMVMSVNVLGATPTVNNDSKFTTSATPGDQDSDTSTITFIKDYIRGIDTQNNSTSPAENFQLTITPIGVWNAGSSTGDAGGVAYNVNNMPLLIHKDDETVNRFNEVTIVEDYNKAGETDNTKKGKTTIILNTYKSVGDFWYEVVETNANTTGVFYGTNSSATTGNDTTSENGNYSSKYYIHVQVVNNPSFNKNNQEIDTNKKFLRSVTMHTVAPGNGTLPANNSAYNTWSTSNYNNSVKVNDIQNTYYAGELSIIKEVKGNAGDKDKRFEVIVTFTKAAGTIINSDITYSAVTTQNGTMSSDMTINGQSRDNSSSWIKSNNTTAGVNDTDQATAQAIIYIKDGETVKFQNIPYGVTYTVAETRPDDDTYTNMFVFENNDNETYFDGISLGADTNKALVERNENKTGNYFGAEHAATGSISDASDVITITNEKNTTIDIGVITSNAPYIAILIFAAAILILSVHRRKNMIEE